MAQLNPNFEIDFSNINSYEQIQLINDTQLAKENLLMHRAYKEPSDDEIIRNHFSSFTFVDFCPRLFVSKTGSGLGSKNAQQQQEQTSHSSQGSSSRSKSHRYYVLESFSDLFDRINVWLKLNKDWRVVSMETLVYDCFSQFNHLKSSIHSSYLPRNTRGLRLFLSPSKSRFSGPQKIGCINVVPRKLSGSHSKPDQPVVYETLDQILNRLNELLLTRPIEGRILSVETITLPMVSGYVNTESNYYMDHWLNLLSQSTYLAPLPPVELQAGEQPAASNTLRNHCLIDILRVYYEFGPLVCGLVNLIDFIPRFYSPTVVSDNNTSDSKLIEEGVVMDPTSQLGCGQQLPKVAASETMTRLVRRSLAWFERERKRISGESGTNEQQINLKACNLQLCHKTLPKVKLLLVGTNGPKTALDHINTREMLHQRPTGQPQCPVCPPANDCPHLAELSEPYEVKFVRLAYVVPVYNRYARPLRPLPVPRSSPQASSTTVARSQSPSTSSSASSRSSSESSELSEHLTSGGSPSKGQETNENEEVSEEELTKRAALSIVRGTNERQLEDERRHQLPQDFLTCDSSTNNNKLNETLIGQLTYRLFAPCQLVNSSSCFAINPINSSSPLSRRGSVNLSCGGGGGQASLASAQAARKELLSNSDELRNSQQNQQNPTQVVTSFGAFFPAQANDILQQSQQNQSDLAQRLPSNPSLLQQAQVNSIKFATNEFELVEAIRRRMEVYVTTNSMKVIAGETIVVNLSSQLSCLSTAIEQTVSRSPQISNSGSSNESTWVSVYVLYAAVEEPQLPEQLLARQREREVAAMASSSPVFSDDFDQESDTAQVQAGGSGEVQIRIEQNPEDSSLTLYNSAYDRTVALPAPPDNQPMYGADEQEARQIELGDFFPRPDDSLQMDLRESGDDFELVLVHDQRRRRRSAKASSRSHQKRKSRNRLDEAQCSIM